MANNIQNRTRTRSQLQLTINDLTGGFISQVSTYNVAEKYLSDVKNMELFQGYWQKRKGYSLVGSFAGVTINNPRPCRGLHVANIQGNLRVLGVYGKTLYETSLPTVDAQGRILSNTLPESDFVRFANFRNNVFIVTGQGKMLQYNGSNLTEVNTLPGSLLTVYANRLVMAGIKGDDKILYYSELGRGSLWDPLNYILLEGNTNERITALYPLQGKLYIFTNHAIYSLIGNFDNYSVSKEVDGIGAISQEALTVYGNAFFFISEEGKFYYFDGGSYPIEISAPINSYTQAKFTYNDFKFACTTTYNTGVWFTLNNSKQPEKRETLVFYPDYQAWTRFVGIPAAKYFKLGNDLFFTGAHNEGSIYQYGTKYLDDTTFIDASLLTVKWDFDHRENIKRFKDLYLRGSLQGGAGTGFDVDFIVDDAQVASIHVSAESANMNQLWNSGNWGEMYWGFAADSAGTKWGKANWGGFNWNGSELKFNPKWGSNVWGTFNWGAINPGSFPGDVGSLYNKIYLSQYNIISGKTLQLRFRDNTPGHGFRFENLILNYIEKGDR